MSAIAKRALIAVAMVAGVATVPAAPAHAATSDGSYITCTQDTSAKPVYIVMGGAPIWVHSWAAMGTWTSANPHPSAVSTNCSSLRRVPRDGVFFRGWAKGAATGPTYEIVGGAPIVVTAWADLGYTNTSHPTVEKVDAASIPAVAAASQTKDGTQALQGYLNSAPAVGTKFAGYSTTKKAPATFYVLDSARHPVPQVSASAGEVVADQASINLCTRMDCDPSGQLVDVYSTQYGVLHVDGIAMDYPSPDPVSVRFDVGGQSFVVPANQPTDADLPSIAGNHGFSADLPVPWSPSLVLCGTVLGRAPGATTSDIGCSSVSVLGAAPGRVHRPKVRAKGHHRVKVTWPAGTTNGSPISAYLVKLSTGKTKQISGLRRHIVLKHLPGGRRISVKVRAINGVGYGRWSRWSKSVTVR